MGHLTARARYKSRQTRATAVRCTHAPREEKNRVGEGMMLGGVDVGGGGDGVDGGAVVGDGDATTGVMLWLWSLLEVFNIYKVLR